ncbi:MAG: hypothetical protein KAX93_05450 [Flavobacterium sp.]|nr:hypothetical protein [Flavobacterium sp.]MBP8157804.1 hypothetical protein [Flavobacterium sp.]
MKTNALALLLMTVLCVSCNNSKTNTSTTIITEKTAGNDKAQIEKLIKSVNSWGGSANGSYGITYYTIDKKTGNCTGIDRKKHQLELEKLKKSDYFSADFIENFNQIGLKQDQLIKTKKIPAWKPSEEVNPFRNSSPWCNCQDGGDMKKIQIKIIDLNDQKGSLSWTWSEPDYSKGFEYKFNVEKENGKWKIAYLEGFDFEKNTKLE